MKHWRSIKQGASALLLLGSFLTPRDAQAHGGFYRAFEILRTPENADRIVLRSDVWGFTHSSDGGKTWQWSCSEVYGSLSTAPSHPAMQLLADGRLVVANSFRGLRYTDDYCNWTKAAGLDDEVLADVKHAGGSNLIALASTGYEDRIDNALWKSDDRGASFTRFGGSMPEDIVTQSLAISAPPANRIYAIGQVIETSPPVGAFLRSDDGGQTFQRLSAPAKDVVIFTLRIAAVHPTNPDVAFVWIDLPEELGKNSPDEIWLTADGGTSWKQLFSGSGDLPGLALSPDGERIAIAGSVDGVWTGALADVLRDGRAALEQTRTLPIWGLLWQDDGLYGGNDNFPLRGTPEVFTFGLSKDEGRTFSEISNICQIEFSLCSATSSVGQACAALWDDPSQAGGFVQDFFERSGRCNADAGAPPTNVDAGPGPAPSTPPEDGGCCAVVGSSTRSPLEPLVAFSALVLAFGARRSSRKFLRSN